LERIVQEIRAEYCLLSNTLLLTSLVYTLSTHHLGVLLLASDAGKKREKPRSVPAAARGKPRIRSRANDNLCGRRVLADDPPAAATVAISFGILAGLGAAGLG